MLFNVNQRLPTMWGLCVKGQGGKTGTRPICPQRLMLQASSPDVSVLDEVAVSPPKAKKPWNVILYNDDIHTFREVEYQLQKATGCSMEVARHIAQIAHREGRAVAYTGEKEDCERVAGILRQIDLQVDIEENT